MPKQTIEKILQKNTNKWMEIPGVTGTALGIYNNKTCIKIFVTQLTNQLKNQLPEQIENHHIIIEETGTFQARNL
ncbi:MAG: hypothetical protein HQ522_22665 [Bacteroidetes bacterium]|nr:hypothetical protein [Bacteroidota bacterium]